MAWGPTISIHKSGVQGGNQVMTISLVDAVDNSKVAAFEDRQRRGFGRQQYYFEI
jgi:hypothetical protein